MGVHETLLEGIQVPSREYRIQQHDKRKDDKVKITKICKEISKLHSKIFDLQCKVYKIIIY